MKLKKKSSHRQEKNEFHKPNQSPNRTYLQRDEHRAQKQN